MEQLTGRIRGYWSNTELLLWAIMLASLILQLTLALLIPGYVNDQQVFVNWMNGMHLHGLGAKLFQTGDGPNYPFFTLILYVYGKLLSWMHLRLVVGAHLVIKLPMILFYTFANVGFYIVTRSLERRRRLFTMCLFAWNPALMLDSVIWGQIDVFNGALMLFTMTSLWTPGSWRGGLGYAVALLSKFQSIAIAPAIGLLLIFRYLHRQSRTAWSFIIGFVAAVVVILGIYAINGSLRDIFWTTYIQAIGQFPFASVNAMNIWYHFDGHRLISDQAVLFSRITVKSIGFVLVVIASLYVTYCLVWDKAGREKVRYVKAATLLSFTFFMLPTEMHERYNIPTLILCIFVAAYDSRFTRLALGLTMTNLINISSVWYLDANGILLVGRLVVFLNLVMYLWMAWDLRPRVRQECVTDSTMAHQAFSQSLRAHDV